MSGLGSVWVGLHIKNNEMLPAIKINDDKDTARSNLVYIKVTRTITMFCWFWNDSWVSHIETLHDFVISSEPPFFVSFSYMYTRMTWS